MAAFYNHVMRGFCFNALEELCKFRKESAKNYKFTKPCEGSHYYLLAMMSGLIILVILVIFSVQIVVYAGPTYILLFIFRILAMVFNYQTFIQNFQK